VKKVKKASIIGFLLILTGPVVFCQTFLTLGDAISIGLANNYGINIAKNSRQIAENNNTPGNAGMLPKIDVNASYTHGLSNARVEVMSGSELDNSTAKSDLFTAGVYLNWTLFDGMKMFVAYDKLKKLEEMGDLESKIAIENTVAKIIASYYDIVRQAKETAIIREQVGISRFRLDLAKLKYETGSGSEIEFLKAKVELNADISNLSNQETDSANSLATLNELLARDVKTNFIVRDTILLQQQLDYDSLRKNMKDNNRNLLLYNRNKEVSGLEMRSARAVQWPTLGLNVGYNYLHNETEANFINYNQNFGPVVGLSATMNLFNGMNLQRQYRNAKISFESSDMEIKQLENRLDAYLLRIYNDYVNQVELIGFEQENILLAQKNMDIAKESYQVGAISSLQLREIQKNLLDAGTRLVSAEYKAKLTETELLLLSGRLVK
jgi:outer membrane protein TolC